MLLGEIESERMTPIHGSLAYEVVVTPNIPGVKAGVQCINESDHAVIIMLLGDSRNIETKVAECDRIVRDHVQLGAASAQPARTVSVWRRFGSR